MPEVDCWNLTEPTHSSTTQRNQMSVLESRQMYFSVTELRWHGYFHVAIAVCKMMWPLMWIDKRFRVFTLSRCWFATPLVRPETPAKPTTPRWLFVFHCSSALVLPPADSVTLFIIKVALWSDLAADWSSGKGSGCSDTLIGFKATGSEHKHTHTRSGGGVCERQTHMCVGLIMNSKPCSPLFGNQDTSHDK